MAVQKKRLSAKEIIDASLKEAVISGDRTILIRRIGMVDLSAAAGNLADVAALATASDETNLPQGAAEKAAKMMEAVIVRGCVDPKFQSVAEEGFPTPGDLPQEDRVSLFHQIMQHSGFQKEAAERAAPLSGTGR